MKQASPPTTSRQPAADRLDPLHDRQLASSTEFNGQKLLNGGFDYSFDNNFDDQTWTYASVNMAKFSGSSAINVNISVQTAAEQAEALLRDRRGLWPAKTMT